jgi:hypothetical protein
MADTVKVRVHEGYAVFDGKRQVSSRVVTIDADLADQLLVSGAVEPVKGRDRAQAVVTKRDERGVVHSQTHPWLRRATDRVNRLVT